MTLSLSFTGSQLNNINISIAALSAPGTEKLRVINESIVAHLERKYMDVIMSYSSDIAGTGNVTLRLALPKVHSLDYEMENFINENVDMQDRLVIIYIVSIKRPNSQSPLEAVFSIL